MRGSRKSRLFVIVLLAISLIAPSIPQVQADSGEWQVDFSTDDCTRYDATFTLTLTVSPYWASNAYTMGSGMRWRNINIPQGATILSAYIKYRSTGTHVQPASPIVIITGEDEDNCATFSTKLNYDGRTRTEASVEYTLPATIADVWYDTNDLSSIIQEIIDREGWESGYAIALFSGPKDETNIAAGGWSFNRADGSSASKLFITWSEEPPIYPPSDPNLLFGAGFNSSSPYVELHWNHSLVDVQFFEVQNSSDGESWTYLGQSTTANYTDTQVVNGTERYYKVRACNQTGGTWYNSSWADVNFEKVYFIPEFGEGEDFYYLGEFIDDYENEDYVSVKSQVIRNLTLDCMELNYTVGGGEGDYIDSWDTSGEGGLPFGIATDGSNIWTVDLGDAEVYRYTMAGVYLDSWDTSSEAGGPRGITTDGVNIWVVDPADDAVYRYTMAGVYLDSWSTVGHGIQPMGITTDGSNIWTIDDLSDEVYKYTMAGVYVDSWDTSGQGTTPFGITTDGSNIWTVDWIADEVYKYTMAGVYVDSWDTSGQGTDPVGITTDGTYIWTVDYITDEVYKYSMAGGYETSGYFTTTELLSDINGTSLVLLTNSTLNSGTLKVQFSDDNATWVNHNNVGGSDTIIAGYESIDLRDVNSTTLYLRYNFTRGGPELTPRLFQTRLISTEGDIPENGVAINYPAIDKIEFNTTVAEEVCGVSGEFSDIEGLSGYIFWDNATSPPGGANSSWTSLTGTSDSALENITLPSDGTKLGVKYYVNDTDGNWGVDTLVIFPLAAETGDTYVTGSVGIFLMAFFILLPVIFYAVKKK